MATQHQQRGDNVVFVHTFPRGVDVVMARVPNESQHIVATGISCATDTTQFPIAPPNIALCLLTQNECSALCLRL